MEILIAFFFFKDQLWCIFLKDFFFLRIILKNLSNIVSALCFDVLAEKHVGS